MASLSPKTKQLLKDDIVSVLFEKAPVGLFANEIALDLRRDNEFVKGLLLELEKVGVVERVEKSFSGRKYRKRIRWRIPPKVMQAMQRK